MNTKLIVFRGPSASGKSTVAKDLAKRSDRKVALLEEDHFRRVILQAKEPAETRRAICKQMLADNARTALASGFDVILEGILSKQHYVDMLDDLFAGHAGESYLFHFDVSLEETLRRHKLKPIADEVSEAQLREWYTAGNPMHFDFQEMIPESYSKEQAVAHIKKAAGL